MTALDIMNESRKEGSKGSRPDSEGRVMSGG
jgi:hypothetical protein